MFFRPEFAAYRDRIMEKGAKWIGFYTDPAYDESNPDQPYGAPAMYVRKRFSLHKSVQKAEISCTALGVYKLFVNGQEIRSFLEPGFTDYRKRVYEQTYDVTSMLVGGKNAFGACVGDGWYTGNIAMVRRQRFGRYPLKFRACLRLVYRDGSEETVCTDASWEGFTGGLRENDILNGECRDFRLPHAEIFTDAYAEAPAPVQEFAVDVPVFAECCERVELCERLAPSFLRQSARGALIDFGQNFAGVVRLCLRGGRGTRVRVRHGEMLDADGSLYVANLRSARCTDTLILSGGTDEYLPSFTYHGFRYVQIEAEGDVELQSVAAYAVHNRLRPTGSFSCSEALVNRIYSNTLWSMRSNFVSIPTDCPQRDERMGWLADAHLFARSAMYMADCEKFFRRYLLDVSDATGEDGVPDTAPYVNFFGKNNAGWADGAVILPYLHYRMYGDQSIIAENLPLMRRHIRAYMATAEGGIRCKSVYGDWLSLGEETPEDYFSTAYYYYSLTLYLELLGVLGKTDAAVERERGVVYAAFRRRFVGESGRTACDTQTSYVLGYAFGLLTADEAAANLRRKIEENGMKLATGFNGGKFLMPVLSDLKMDDVAYALLLNEDYPGWGYSIANGATTIWERWNSYTEQDGFGDAGMNSFNHYVFGSVVEWMYRYMLGIREDEAGFTKVCVAPHFDPLGRIRSASGSYETKLGAVKVSWESENAGYTVRVECPECIPLRFDFGDGEVLSHCCKRGEHVFRIGCGRPAEKPQPRVAAVQAL